MSDLNVAGLFRYPVKSMSGESLSSLTIGAGGVPGDRAWAVRDEERGGIRGGKRFAELMACHASYETEPEEGRVPAALVTLPDGQTAMSSDDALPGKLSDLVGSALTVWPLLPKEAVDHYRRGAPVLEDMEAELRRMFARTPDEPLPDLSVFPPELMEFESPLGTYFDAFPLLVMTRQSIEYMQSCSPEQTWDVRRFRPNILLDCVDDEGLVEAAWEGQQLKVGSALLQLEVKCPRCVMTTHGFDDIKTDPGVMRSLVKDAEGCLGIYASVITAGVVGLGESAVLLGD